MTFLFYQDISADGTKIVFMAEFFAGSKFVALMELVFPAHKSFFIDGATKLESFLFRTSGR